MRGIAAALCTSYAPCPCPGEALVPASRCSLAQPSFLFRHWSKFLPWHEGAGGLEEQRWLREFASQGLGVTSR